MDVWKESADSKDMVCVEARFCLQVASAAGVEGRSRKKLHQKSTINHVTLQIVQNIYFGRYYHQITADAFDSSIIMKTIGKNKSSTTISDIPDGFTTRRPTLSGATVYGASLGSGICVLLEEGWITCWESASRGKWCPQFWMRAWVLVGTIHHQPNLSWYRPSPTKS